MMDDIIDVSEEQRKVDERHARYEHPNQIATITVDIRVYEGDPTPEYVARDVEVALNNAGYYDVDLDIKEA